MMNKKISGFFLLLMFLFSSNLIAQGFTKEEKVILEMQDKRTLGKDNELPGYLQSKDEKIISRTLIALANIADTTTTDNIGNLLINSASSKVRSAAAFALGEITS